MSSLMHILPGKSDNHQFVTLHTLFYIYQGSTSSVILFKRKGAKITEIWRLSDNHFGLGHHGYRHARGLINSLHVGSNERTNLNQDVFFQHVLDHLDFNMQDRYIMRTYSFKPVSNQMPVSVWVCWNNHRLHPTPLPRWWITGGLCSKLQEI